MWPTSRPGGDGLSVVRIGLMAGAVVAVLLHCWRFRDFTVDDAAISFSYARNLAEGHGLVLIAGGERVEGYSNFLWVLMLAAGARAGVDLFSWAHLLGGVSAAFTIIGVCSLSTALRVGSSLFEITPALLTAALVPVPYWAMSGLEGGLYTALVVWCAATLARDVARSSRWPASAWLAAAVALTRPDGAAVLVGAAVIFCLASQPRRAKAWWLAIALAPLVAQLLWRRSYYAFWLPNTFYAKTHRSLSFSLSSSRSLSRVWGKVIDLGSPGWRYVLAFCQRYWLGALAVPALLSLRPGRRAGARWGTWLLLLCVMVFPLYAGGDWMSEGRFLVAGVPLLCVLAWSGVEGIARGRHRRLILGFWAVGTCLLIAPHAGSLSARRKGNYPVSARTVARRGQLYRDLARTYAIEHPSALDGDLGGTSLYAGMQIVDLGMLGDVTLARWQGDRAIWREYIHHERQPTFLNLPGFWGALGVQDAPEFLDRYLPLPASPGIFVDRRAFLDPIIDTRRMVASFPDLGLDLVSAAVQDGVRLRLLVRKPQTAARLRIVAETGAAQDVAHKLLPFSAWRAGDVLDVDLPRPGPGPLRLCDDQTQTCLPVAEGASWARPFTAPPPPDALEDSLRRRDWEVALRIARARHDSTTFIARQLFQRAEAFTATGDTGRAFRDYTLALLGDPGLAQARRRIEELRLSPRPHFHEQVEQRHEQSLRAFLLDPTAEHLATLATLGRPLDDPTAALLHLATGLRPPDTAAALDLAELLSTNGWFEEGRAMLPHARLAPPDSARAAAVRARSMTPGEEGPPGPPGREIAPGLRLTVAWARLGPDGRVDLTLALRRTSFNQPGLRIAGGTSLFDRPPESWGTDEIYLHEVRLELPAGRSQIDVGGHAVVTVDVNPFTQDFELGAIAGWISVGETVWHASPFRNGFPGHQGHWLLDADVVTGPGPAQLRSPPLGPDIEQVCLSLWGSAAGAGVRIGDPGPIAAGDGGKAMKSVCLDARGRGGAPLTVFKQGGAASVMVDDITCFVADRPAPCAGGAQVVGDPAAE